jgi:hypothetical protein
MLFWARTQLKHQLFLGSSDCLVLLLFFKFFLGSNRYQMQPENYLGPKLRDLDQYKYPKKLFLNFFLRFLRDLVSVPKAKKWYFSDFVPVLKVNSEYLKNKNLIFHF